ncbi:MAG: hypothetical protein LR015_15380 [Verrucomicrobia bacterium]|nr:hypothetical protein [Verrucomicrobiota bacterium]
MKRDATIAILHLLAFFPALDGRFKLITTDVASGMGSESTAMSVAHNWSEQEMMDHGYCEILSGQFLEIGLVRANAWACLRVRSTYP